MTPARWSKHSTRLVSWGACLLVASLVAIVFALRVTPTQSVSSVGQTVEVGAAPLSLDVSGPGRVDLFGQSLSTKVDFAGPIRPKLVLTRITLTEQIADILEPDSRAQTEHLLGASLADGWRRYFVWESLFAGIGVLVLLAAVAGILRTSWKRTAALLAVGVVLTEALNVGGILLTARNTPRILARADSLSALLGRTERPLVAARPGAPHPDVDAVVLGDSTAAGVGNPLVAHPSRLDKACERSSEAFGVALGRANHWKVDNLACSGATVRAGLLGRQDLGSLSAPAQLAETNAGQRAGLRVERGRERPRVGSHGEALRGGVVL